MSSFNIESIKDKINGFVAAYPMVDGAIGKISAQSKIDKAYIAVAIAMFPILLVFMMGAGDVIIDLVGFIYPVYASIKAIETATKVDDQFWLTYWIIFGTFKVAEGVFDFLISFIPFYFIIKLAFLIWCYNPSSKGADIIYSTVVKPYVVPLLGVTEKGEKSE